MKKVIFTGCILFVWTFSSFTQNIMITNKNNPNEPSIMMDPAQPHVLVAGTNLNFSYMSTDTGRTWSRTVLSSTYGVWGDPVIMVDTAGTFYYFHLSNPAEGSWIDRIVCQKSTDQGDTWSDGTFTGKNGTKAQDKPWAVVDRSNNNIYVTWTQFDKYGSTKEGDSTIILFSKSTDQGETWSEPLRINAVAGDCLDDDNSVEGAVPTIGTNGEIFVAWAGPSGLVFNRSLDKGETWLPQEVHVDPMPGGWNYEIPGIMRANGLPVTACDTGSSPFRGTIYINWSDQRNCTTNTDVWLSKSTDGGDTWSPPVRVNNDESEKHQFFTWMTIDQTTGWLFFIFYDRRSYDTDSTDVYMAISKDGGNTFTNHRISESPFYPDKDIFFGDYTNIVAHNGVVRPIWTRLNNGQLSIWTNISSLEEIVNVAEKKERNNDKLAFENFPNPSSGYVYISFKLYEKSKVSLGLYDTKGRLKYRVVHEENRDYGRYIEKIDINSLKLSTGTYFLRLKVNDEEKTSRQIIVK